MGRYIVQIEIETNRPKRDLEGEPLWQLALGPASDLRVVKVDVGNLGDRVSFRDDIRTKANPKGKSKS